MVVAFLRPETSAVLATAQVTGMALVFEDRRIRDLAREWRVSRTSWTQPLLLAMKERQMLSASDYMVLVSSLLEQRIGFTMVGEADLTSALAVGDLVSFRHWADILMNKLASADSIATVAAKVIRLAVRAHGLGSSNDRWIESLLSALNRSGRDDTIALLGNIERRAAQMIGDDMGDDEVDQWRRFTRRFRATHYLPIR